MFLKKENTWQLLEILPQNSEPKEAAETSHFCLCVQDANHIQANTTFSSEAHPPTQASPHRNILQTLCKLFFELPP